MKSFTARVSVAFGVLVTATTAALLVVGGWLLHRQLINSIELLHDIEGEELGQLIASQPNLTAAEVARRIKAEADSDLALFFIQIHQEDGVLFFRSENLGDAILPALSPAHRARVTVAGPGPLWVSEYTAGPWHIQIGSRLSPVAAVVEDYVRVSAVLMLAAALLSAALGRGFSRFVLRPVRAIEQTAQRIRGDNLGERIPVPPGQDELSALARLLNQMFDRLQAAFAQVQRFTADASHELKTPLALVRLHAEKLRPQLAAQPGIAASCDELLEELARLQQIVDRLLFLSRAESGALLLERRSFEVDDWLRELAEDGNVLAEDRGARFALVHSDAGTYTGEPTLLRQLLLNLASNALRYTPPGGTVTLASHRMDGGWRWCVEDEGPGVPPDQLEWIFERFARLPGGGDRDETAGQGLGLAICRSIAALHGGTIVAVNRNDRSGLRVEVRLPPPPEPSAGGTPQRR